jgi:phosphoribosylglycinamide formyltransferase-1
MSKFAPVINAAIFASGEGTNAENLIQYFSGDSRIRIKFIVSSRENAGVVNRALRLRKPVHILGRTELNANLPQFIEYLKSENIGLIILSGWLLKIPAELVESFRGRIINIHPALLPNYGGKGMYGMHVHRAVLQARDPATGITVHFVDEEYDSGDVILQEKVAIDPADTAEIISAKVRELEFQYYPRAIEQLLQKIDTAG